MKHFLIILFTFLTSYASQGQLVRNFGKMDSTYHPGKIRFIGITVGGAYTASIVGLASIWYKDVPKSSFHWFDDSQEWLQMDKVGHGFTAFHESRYLTDLYCWAGVKPKKAAIYGGLSGFLLQLPIEVLDGYSEKWGASWTDLAANTTGSFLYSTQRILWNEVYLTPKFSFHRTKYASKRPAALGSSWNEEIIKDYNGQTYWISMRLDPIHQNIPKWLCLSVGYGADGMIFAHEEDNEINNLDPHRQFYLSLDVDWSQIKTNKKWLNTVFYSLNFIKLPFPTLEMGNHNMMFRPLYF